MAEAQVVWQHSVVRAGICVERRLGSPKHAMMPLMDWSEPVVRGVVALLGALLLGLLAKARFRGKDDTVAPQDLGLD